MPGLIIFPFFKDALTREKCRAQLWKLNRMKWKIKNIELFGLENRQDNGEASLQKYSRIL